MAAACQTARGCNKLLVSDCMNTVQMLTKIVMIMVTISLTSTGQPMISVSLMIMIATATVTRKKKTNLKSSK